MTSPRQIQTDPTSLEDAIPLDVHVYMQNFLGKNARIQLNGASSFFHTVTLVNAFSSYDVVSTKLQKQIFRLPDLVSGSQTYIEPGKLLRCLTQNSRLNYHDKLCGWLYLTKQLNISVAYDLTDLYAVMEGNQFNASLLHILNAILTSDLVIDLYILKKISGIVITSFSHDSENINWEVLASIMANLYIKRKFPLVTCDLDLLIRHCSLHANAAIRQVIANILSIASPPPEDFNLDQFLQELASKSYSDLHQLIRTIPQLNLIDLKKVHDQAARFSSSRKLFAITMHYLPAEYRDHNFIEACCNDLMPNHAIWPEGYHPNQIVFITQFRLLTKEKKTSARDDLFKKLLKYIKKEPLLQKAILRLLKTILTENPELIKQYFGVIVDALFATHEIKSKSGKIIKKDKIRNPELTFYIVSLLIKHTDKIELPEAGLIFHELSDYHYLKRNYETERQIRLFSKKISEEFRCQHANLIDQLIASEETLQQITWSSLSSLTCLQPKHEKFAKVMGTLLLNLNDPSKAQTACLMLQHFALIASQKQQEEMITKTIELLKNKHEAKTDYQRLLCKLVSNYSHQFNSLPNAILTNFINLYVPEENDSYAYLYELVSMPAILLQLRSALVNVLQLLDPLIAIDTYFTLCSALQLKLSHFYLEISSASYDDPEISSYLIQYKNHSRYLSSPLQLIFKLQDAVKDNLSALPTCHPPGP